MTIQQEAASIIDTMPDDTVKIIIELLHKLSPNNQYMMDVAADHAATKRIGVAKGKIFYPDDFEAMDDELADNRGFYPYP